ncbi:MAG: DUF4249 domain-containing protein [Mediterranea sp.]|nr:DUF4249 domain-containing protein [Mediterranea sp.]
MKKIIYLLLTVAFPSCNYHFELDGVDATEKLVLYCFPSNSDTTVIQLSRSVPVNKKEPSDKNMRNADIHLTVNEEEQAIYWNEDPTSTLPAQCYYTLRKWKPDDCLQLQANVKDMPVITAKTTMPGNFPLEEIRMIPKKGSKNTLQVLITFNDDSATKDHYGIRLVKKRITRSDDEENVSFHSVEFDLKDEPLLNNLSDLDEIFMSSNHFFQDLYIWDDTEIQGRKYTLRLNTDYQEDFEVNWDNYNFSLSLQYKIYLYRLSPEFYNYFKTLNTINNNDLGNHGFSPTFLHYTNVSGGIGVMGGCRITETEWLKNAH